MSDGPTRHQDLATSHQNKVPLSWFASPEERVPGSRTPGPQDRDAPESVLPFSSGTSVPSPLDTRPGSVPSPLDTYPGSVPSPLDTHPDSVPSSFDHLTRPASTPPTTVPDPFIC